MKKIVLVAALFLLGALLLYSPRSTFAQSPIRCGLLDEPCCNFAGGEPNSCQSGLICDNGTCVADPNASNTPNRRGQGPNVPSTGNDDPTAGCNEKSVNTAIGCIPVGDPNEFVGFILNWAIGIGGGIAFLLIVFSGFQIMTSSGNPERLQAGKELMTSAIAGLIMLVFSVFILRIIGVDILGLGDLGLGG